MTSRTSATSIRLEICALISLEKLILSVVCSTIKSDHRAVIASASNTNITDLHKVKTQYQYRKRTPDQRATLLSYLSTFSWDTVYQQTDTQSAFDVFYGLTLDILNRFYPLQTITTTNRDPHFITPTPRIKALLKHRNRLMRTGAVAAADSITSRIGQRIKSHNRALLLHLPRGSTQMSAQVRKVTGKEKCNHEVCKDVTTNSSTSTLLPYQPIQTTDHLT